MLGDLMSTKVHVLTKFGHYLMKTVRVDTKATTSSYYYYYYYYNNTERRRNHTRTISHFQFMEMA